MGTVGNDLCGMFLTFPDFWEMVGNVLRKLTFTMHAIRLMTDSKARYEVYEL